MSTTFRSCPLLDHPILGLPRQDIGSLEDLASQLNSKAKLLFAVLFQSCFVCGASVSLLCCYVYIYAMALMPQAVGFQTESRMDGTQGLK